MKWLSLPSCLLSILIWRSLAFLPTELLSKYHLDGKNHQQISTCALNEVAIRLIDKLNSTSGSYTPKSSSWEECATLEDIAKHCSSNGLPCRVYKDAVKSIINSNAKVDKEERTNPLAHFDAESFVETNNILIVMKQAAIRAITRSEDYFVARQIVGRILHTIQDFYSHSNWVELGKTDLNPAVVRHNDFGDVAGPEETTCKNCDRISNCTDACDSYRLWEFPNCTKTCIDQPGIYTCPDDRLKTNKLTSGYYGKPVDIDKCSHGGVFDESSGSTPTGGINKDTMDEVFSPHYYLHETAASLALKATVQFLDDIWYQVGNAAFTRFLGIEETGCLIIVVDVTNSMQEEIEAVKKTAKRLADEVKGNKEPSINYILSPFSDPEVGPVIVTKDVEFFKDEIDRLRAGMHGSGGDDAELSLSGMLAALEKSQVNSKLFVFTDAAAKDDHLETQVTSLARTKNVEMNFLLTMVARQRHSDETYRVYRSISSSTGGIVIFTSKDQVQNVSLAMINVDEIVAPRVELLHLSSPPFAAGYSLYHFIVDETLFEITAEASATGDITSFHMYKAGQLLNVKRSVDSARLKRISVSWPSPGAYQISLRTNHSSNIKVSGKSHLQADVALGSFYFGKGHPGFFESESEPIVGSEVAAKAEIFSSGISGLVLDNIWLVDEKWNLLGQADFHPSESRMYFSEFVVPSKPFRILVKGNYSSADGCRQEFQRLDSKLRNPSQIEIKSNNSETSEFVQIKKQLELNYTVTNYGPAGDVYVAATDSAGMILKKVVLLRFSTNETQSYDFKVSGKAGIEPGTVNTITVMAGARGGPTNYATKYVVVMPENIDSFVPDIEITSSNADSCRGLLENECASRSFNMSFSFNDSESGLARIAARRLPNGEIGPVFEETCNKSRCDASRYAVFRYDNFTVGQIEPVVGRLEASCCVGVLEVLASDTDGNLRQLSIDTKSSADEICISTPLAFSMTILMTVLLFHC